MSSQQYNRLTFRAWLELITPNTLGVSIIPALLGGVLAYALNDNFSWPYFILLFMAAVLMQCAVNAFNPGYDFLKGTDTIENSLDPTDAPVVHHGFNPKTAIRLGFLYLFLALILAFPVILQTGPTILVIGIMGALVVYCYTAGPFPITHTPLGEMFAGLMAGGLIPLAIYYALTLDLDFRILWYASPMIISIAMLLFLNNICDIEKDIRANRRTLPVLIGRPAATILLRAFYALKVLLIGIIGMMDFRAGMWLYIPLLIMAFPKLKVLFNLKLTAENRITGMRTILPLMLILGFHYVFIILLATLLHG